MKYSVATTVPSTTRIIGIAEVMSRTGDSKSKIYRDMRAGKFPLQAKKLEGSRSAGWFEDEIDAHLEARRPDSEIRVHQPGAKPDHTPRDRQLSSARLPTGDSRLVANSNPAGQKSVVTSAETTFVAMGMKINGSEVYCHKPSRKLYIEVGSISQDALARLDQRRLQ